MSKFFMFEGDDAKFNLDHVVSVTSPVDDEDDYAMLLVTGEAVALTPGEYDALCAFIDEHGGGVVELKVEEPDGDEEPEGDENEGE